MTDLWEAGYVNGPAVPVDVPPAVPPAVPFNVPPDVLQGVPVDVPPGDSGDTVPPATEPLNVGDWQEAKGEPDNDGGLRDLITRLAALTKASPLLGGAGLAAELASPHPDTWTRHLGHVTSHKNLPAGQVTGFLFIVGHLLVTGPVKFTGQVMTVTGDALSWSGKRVNRASDRFLAAIILIILTAVTALIIVAVGSYLVSQLP